MTISRVDLGGATVELPDDWLDISEDGDDLMSLAKQNGVGVLQFSIGAEYLGGVEPDVGQDDLLGMLRSLAERRGFGPLQEITFQEGVMRGVASDFFPVGYQVRAWYLSNGLDVALLTYVVQSEHMESARQELEEATEIAKSLQFYQ